jgi:cell wall-associated NlpC family hydrolase
VRRQGDFAVSDKGGFIPARHLAPLESREQDFVAVARRFIGTPYLWGGRSSLGIDCSGLVQIALQSAGQNCPRDSDMQAAFGSPVAFDGDIGVLRRGDLVCWKGHIGIVSGPDLLLHANAFHMAVAEEPLSAAIARIATPGADVQACEGPNCGPSRSARRRRAWTARDSATRTSPDGRQRRHP